MLLDLTDIFSMQIKLDHNIQTRHGVTYQTIVDEIKLALLVELGELANEVRCFKFWSNKNASDRNTILEEYVDGIHFMISICIRLHVKCEFYINDVGIVNDKKELTREFNKLFELSNNLNDEKNVMQWCQKYLELGYKLGFTLIDIKQAYIKKNEINFQRQLNNY